MNCKKTVYNIAYTYISSDIIGQSSRVCVTI